ncbi:hypothetical protein DS901_09165 [Loktanella sp. D2R18]|uniref:inositol monophosphatase family protein n=1 Tax=Rhodobacterales TaxID=204455 RepID=UPI000DEBD784|nr:MULTISPECIES: inositol monophosphatase [Rhodobacterales]MDO6591473.1 inositol monophosphatase [Yoonia sp. 1_MG-2023]RBW43886.1 hypothetical protein DS901_09165 [Loktanella sp. D2R18]
MTDYLDATLDMARSAGALAQKMRQHPADMDSTIKGPMDVVTAADIAVENLLRQRITAIDPNAAILGEEGGLDTHKPCTWIVDPIDGTVNFYRGSSDWAVSIARYNGSALELGVIHAPDLGVTAWAESGKGCYINNVPVRLDNEPTAAPLVALGTSPRSSLSDYLDRITRLHANGIEHRRNGAATIGFLAVLSGWVDAFHEPLLNIWDVAAGLILLEEAGGVVWHDKPLNDFLQAPSDVLVHNACVPEVDSLLKKDA